MTTTTEPTLKQHVFERAGLGLAPFSLVAYERKTYQACQGAPIQPGASCDYCGTGIMDVYWIQATCRRQFKVGSDCVRKTGDAGLRAAVNEKQRERRAAVKVEKAAARAVQGQLDAPAKLAAAGLSAAWALHESPRGENEPYEEQTVRSIVGRMVAGSAVSSRALDFVRDLLARIEKRAEVEAKRAAERAAAKPCPSGRITAQGVIVKVAEYKSRFRRNGSDTKITVKTDDGYLLWATLTSSAWAKFSTEQRTRLVGQRIELTATVTPSDRDPQFGFAKRPIIKPVEGAVA